MVGWTSQLGLISLPLPIPSFGVLHSFRGPTKGLHLHTRNEIKFEARLTFHICSWFRSEWTRRVSHTVEFRTWNTAGNWSHRRSYSLKAVKLYVFKTKKRCRYSYNIFLIAWHSHGMPSLCWLGSSELALRGDRNNCRAGERWQWHLKSLSRK